MEDVAFISNTVLLNLSSEEMMTFKRVGEPSPPSSPTPEDDSAVADDSAIAQAFSGQDDMMVFMSSIMQKCLERTGLDQSMKSLPKSQQLVIAERIQKAKEGMLDRLMSETDKMKTGEKVITADVVRKCMSQMEGEY